MGTEANAVNPVNGTLNWICCPRGLFSLLAVFPLALTLSTATRALTWPDAASATGASSAPVNGSESAALMGSAPSAGSPGSTTSLDGAPSREELQELVGPIALYPDDLLALVLPASTFPIHIVQASRFLAAREQDSQLDLEPDPEWDASILALLNYPEALALLNEDLNWTWQLGEAVVEDQAAVMDAVQRFRQRVYAVGNLESNEQQRVLHEGDVIVIEAAEPEVIYVPSYLPSRVLVVHTGAPLYYYSVGYPYYYYPAAPFWTGFYFGSAGLVFGLNWGLYGYPYYGHHNHHISVYREHRVPSERRRAVHGKPGRNRNRAERGQAWGLDSQPMQGGRPGQGMRGREIARTGTTDGRRARGSSATAPSREFSRSRETAKLQARGSERRGESTRQGSRATRGRNDSRNASDSRDSADSRSSADSAKAADSGRARDSSSRGSAASADAITVSSRPTKVSSKEGRSKPAKSSIGSGRRDRAKSATAKSSRQRGAFRSLGRSPRAAKAQPRSSGRSRPRVRASSGGGRKAARGGGGKGRRRRGG